MAKARLRFGTQTSADVKLFLTGQLCEEEYGGNPVYLHFQILKRLKNFQGNFFNCRSSDKPTEIRVTTSHNFDHYLKRIEIMYGEHVDFLNIEECLAILSVASEMVAEESIFKCMQYLEAVRWSADEESQIRKVLSFEGLKLKILPDLAARLNPDDDDGHIIFVEKIIQGMVSLSASLPKSRKTAEKDLIRIFDENTSRDVMDVCGRVLLQRLKASIDSRNFLIINRCLNLIFHCNGRILEAAHKAFCEDTEFIKYVKENYNAERIAKPVFDIITWFMKSTGDGKIIISRASRVSFLTTWLPIMTTFNKPKTIQDKLEATFNKHESIEDKLEEFDKAVLKVVESLPQVDQKLICVVWAEIYRSSEIDIPTPYALAKFLLV